MAGFIITGDQPDVRLNPRGSSERVPDTYARPAAPPPADTSVGDALMDLSKIAQGIDDKQAAKDKELAHLYQAQLTAAMQGSTGFNQTVADGVLNSVHPRVRSYVTELYGKSKGEEAFRQWFASPEGQAGMPDAVTDPAAYEKWKQGAGARAMQAAGETNLWYRNGFLQSFNAATASHGRTLDANRNQAITQQAILQSTQNIARGTSAGTPDVTRAPDPQKASSTIATAQEMGIDPIHLAAIMSFETKGKFDPNLEHDTYLPEGKAGVKIPGFARGLIGFIPDNWEKYGIKPNMTYDEQLKSVSAYLRDRARQTGVELRGLDAKGLYKLINPGYNGDQFLREVQGQGHLTKAMEFLGYNQNTSRFVGAGDPRTRANVARNDAVWGNPDAPDFVAKYLTTVRTASGASLKIHKNAAPAFEGFFKELEGMGYRIRPESTSSYNNRNIRGGTSKSQHAWANAVDINAYAGNGFGAGAKNNLPPNIADIAAKYGLRWGGTFRRPDPMHFEFVGLPGGASPPPPAQAVTLPSDRQIGATAGAAAATAAGATAGAAGATAPADAQIPTGTPRMPEFNPLTATNPKIAVWRSRFFDADGDFKNISGGDGPVPPYISSKMNEEAWKQVKEMAISENDPSWLTQAFPARHLTTERRIEMRQTLEAIEKRNAAKLRQAASAAKEAKKEAEEKWTNDAANLMLRNDKQGYEEHVKRAILAGNISTATVEKLNVMKEKIGWGGTQIVRDPEAEAATATAIELGMARAVAMGQRPEDFLFDYVRTNPSAAIGGQKNLQTLLEKARTLGKESDVMSSPLITGVFTNVVAQTFGIDMTTLKTTPKNPQHAAIWLDYHNDMLRRVAGWRADPANAKSTAPDNLWLREQSQEAAKRVIKAYSSESDMRQLPVNLGGETQPGKLRTDRGAAAPTQQPTNQPKQPTNQPNGSSPPNNNNIEKKFNEEVKKFKELMGR